MTTSSTASPDHAPGLERAFTFVPTASEQQTLRVEGELPSWLRGNYYLNGPARFGRGDVRYRHWLDGDGMVVRLRFDGSCVELTNRFVESAKWCAEEEAGKALYRTFGTAFAGDQLLRGVALASPVNVSVYPFAGTLLAFGEQGLPWELDPETLATRGEHTFGRRLNAVSPFSAHPNFDPKTGEMFNFGVSFATSEPLLTLYRFASDGTLHYRRRHAIAFPASVHDFGLSQRYLLVYLAPYLLAMEPFLASGASVMDALRWEPRLGSRLLIYERETGEAVADLAIGEGYCLHHINAFEADGRLHVDVIELVEPVYKDYHPLPELFTEVAPAQPARLVIDVAKGEVVERVGLPFHLASDFAAIDTHLTSLPYDHFWMLSIAATGKPGRKFLDRLVHLRWDRPGEEDIWAAPAGRFFAAEPVMVPHDRPEEGVVIVPMLDVESLTTSFEVFDAQEIAAGPIASLAVDRPLHLGFHTTFHPAG